MEARTFFENSSMAEITVSATPEEWMDLLVDIDYYVGLLFEDYRRTGSVLEPGTERLLEVLRSEGVTI